MLSEHTFTLGVLNDRPVYHAVCIHTVEVRPSTNLWAMAELRNAHTAQDQMSRSQPIDAVRMSGPDALYNPRILESL